jgi:hypothetical protein
MSGKKRLKEAIPKKDIETRIEADTSKWDIQLVLSIVWNNWNLVFKKTLGNTERSYVSELRDVRNRWAHQNGFTYDDTYRALDSMTRLLRSVSAKEAEDVDKIAQETMRVRFAEQARQEVRRKTGTPVEGSPVLGLKPWREVVFPHPDVAEGKYQQAEFAADLEQFGPEKPAASMETKGIF